MTETKATTAKVRPEVKSDVEAYNKVVAEAELHDIRLLELRFKVKPEYYGCLKDESEGKKKIERSYETEFVELSYDSDQRTLGGQFIWSVDATIGRKKLLTLSATLFVFYSKVPDVSEEVLEKYVNRVGRFATYPYFRGLVARMSWESQADLPIMPVLK